MTTTMPGPVPAHLPLSEDMAVPPPNPTDGPTLRGTLPGSAYTDPAYYAQEQERVFEAMWVCTVRADELPVPGAFRTVQVGRESVIVTRARDGALRAFFNVCRHRGAQLCTEPAGQLRRTLQCPYHAWTYDLDGRLVAAPNLASMPDVDRVAQGLVRVHLREWLGYVWLCVADEPPSFAADVQDAVVTRLGSVAALDSWDVSGLALGRRVTYDVAANWKLIVENFMECYHCATIHPELTEVLPEFADGYAAQSYVGHGAQFGDDVAGFTVDGSAGFAPLSGVSVDQDRRYYAVTIRPQVFLNLVPDHVIVHRMTPLAADRTRVECDWLYAPELLATEPDLDRSVELFHRVNQQDFAACERTQPAMSSRVYREGGVLVPAEHHLTEFHDWLRERLA